jgi:hypothetical protein
MTCPELPAKALIRSRLVGARSDTGLRDLMRGAFLAIPPPRAENVRKSHRGFDWRQTKRLFSNRLTLVRESFLPLPLIGWYGNSHAILLFRRAGE